LSTRFTSWPSRGCLLTRSVALRFGPDDGRC
jgi:hypothetical protein